MREGRSSDFLEPWMDATKRRTNQFIEYWYMGSMLPMSEMQKKMRDVCCATGR